MDDAGTRRSGRARRTVTRFEEQFAETAPRRRRQQQPERRSSRSGRTAHTRGQYVDPGSDFDELSGEEYVARRRGSRRTRNRVNYADDEEAFSDEGPVDNYWTNPVGSTITIGEILDHRKIRRPKRHKHPQPDAGCVQGIAESSGYCGLCQTSGVVVERKIGDEDAERSGRTGPHTDADSTPQATPTEVEKEELHTMTEYLVRWDKASYMWATWELGSTLMSSTFNGKYLKGPRKFLNYKQRARREARSWVRMGLEEREAELVEQAIRRENLHEFLKVERVLAKRTPEDSGWEPHLLRGAVLPNADELVVLKEQQRQATAAAEAQAVAVAPPDPEVNAWKPDGASAADVAAAEALTTAKSEPAVPAATVPPHLVAQKVVAHIPDEVPSSSPKATDVGETTQAGTASTPTTSTADSGWSTVDGSSGLPPPPPPPPISTGSASLPPPPAPPVTSPVAPAELPSGPNAVDAMEEDDEEEEAELEDSEDESEDDDDDDDDDAYGEEDDDDDDEEDESRAKRKSKSAAPWGSRTSGSSYANVSTTQSATPAREENVLESAATTQYFIKWANLPYSECTWESELDILRLAAGTACHTAENVQEARRKDVTGLERAKRDFYARVSRTRQRLPAIPAVSARPALYAGISQHINADLIARGSIPSEEHQVGVKVQPPWLKNGELRDYQIQGIDWMLRAWSENRNVILADEMGLGKTVQCIGVLATLASRAINIAGPFLVVVPLSTLTNWHREFQKWAPQLNVIPYIGAKDSRSIIGVHEWAHVARSVVLTTFEYVQKDKATFRRVTWQHMVVDEAHRLKNPTTTLYQVLLEFNIQNLVLCTGTPLQNNLRELWGLLHFLDQSCFADVEDFMEQYAPLDFDSGEAHSAEEVLQARKELDEVMVMRMLRRDKTSVFTAVPPKHHLILPAVMTASQRRYYKLILTRNLKKLAEATSTGGKGGASLQNVMMQLLKCCNHPFLIEGARNVLESKSKLDEDDLDPDPKKARQQIIAHRIKLMLQHCGKLQLLDKLLQKLQSGGHRVLIFTQMVRLLDLLQEYCALRGFIHQRLDGSTPRGLRQAAIDHFNAPNSADFVFLLSTRAGGLGINLTSADTVIIFDSDWNPQNDLQAESRCHRIGQTKTVRVFKLLTQQTIEEKIISRAKEKLVLDHLVIQAATVTADPLRLDDDNGSDHGGSNGDDGYDHGAEGESSWGQRRSQRLAAATVVLQQAKESEEAGARSKKRRSRFSAEELKEILRFGATQLFFGGEGSGATQGTAASGQQPQSASTAAASSSGEGGAGAAGGDATGEHMEGVDEVAVDVDALIEKADEERRRMEETVKRVARGDADFKSSMKQLTAVGTDRTPSKPVAKPRTDAGTGGGAWTAVAEGESVSGAASAANRNGGAAGDTGSTGGLRDAAEKLAEPESAMRAGPNSSSLFDAFRVADVSTDQAFWNELSANSGGNVEAETSELFGELPSGAEDQDDVNAKVDRKALGWDDSDSDSLYEGAFGKPGEGEEGEEGEDELEDGELKSDEEGADAHRHAEDDEEEDGDDDEDDDYNGGGRSPQSRKLARQARAKERRKTRGPHARAGCPLQAEDLRRVERYLLKFGAIRSELFFRYQDEGAGTDGGAGNGSAGEKVGGAAADDNAVSTMLPGEHFMYGTPWNEQYGWYIGDDGFSDDRWNLHSTAQCLRRPLTEVRWICGMFLGLCLREASSGRDCNPVPREGEDSTSAPAKRRKRWQESSTPLTEVGESIIQADTIRVELNPQKHVMLKFGEVAAAVNATAVVQRVVTLWGLCRVMNACLGDLNAPLANPHDANRVHGPAHERHKADVQALRPCMIGGKTSSLFRKRFPRMVELLQRYVSGDIDDAELAKQQKMLRKAVKLFGEKGTVRGATQWQSLWRPWKSESKYAWTTTKDCQLLLQMHSRGMSEWEAIGRTAALRVVPAGVQPEDKLDESGMLEHINGKSLRRRGAELLRLCKPSHQLMVMTKVVGPTVGEQVPTPRPGSLLERYMHENGVQLARPSGGSGVAGTGGVTGDGGTRKRKAAARPDEASTAKRQTYSWTDQDAWKHLQANRQIVVKLQKLPSWGKKHGEEKAQRKEAQYVEELGGQLRLSTKGVKPVDRRVSLQQYLWRSIGKLLRWSDARVQGLIDTHAR